MFESNKIYKIVCAMTGTVLDISPSDNKSLVGNDWKGTDRQKWHAVQDDELWIIKNVATGHHVGIEGVAVNNTTAIVTYRRFRWDIVPAEDVPSTYRLFVPNTHFNLDLYGGGAAPGTHVEVWEKIHAGSMQKWRFELV